MKKNAKPAAKPTSTPSVANKTYLVRRHSEGLLKVTVPANWRVTFGPIVAGNSRHGYNGGEACLRFYESKDQVRAIFTNVTEFRDLSIPVLKRFVEKRAKNEHEIKKNGEKHSGEKVEHVTWINEGDPADADEAVPF